jgi:hypothetical protein
MLFCHSELVSESKNEKLKQVQLDKKEKRITSFSSRIVSKYKYFGFPPPIARNCIPCPQSTSKQSY